jgi:hypothetical protein
MTNYQINPDDVGEYIPLRRELRERIDEIKRLVNVLVPNDQNPTQPLDTESQFNYLNDIFKKCLKIDIIIDENNVREPAIEVYFLSELRSYDRVREIANSPGLNIHNTIYHGEILKHNNNDRRTSISIAILTFFLLIYTCIFLALEIMHDTELDLPSNICGIPLIWMLIVPNIIIIAAAFILFLPYDKKRAFHKYKKILQSTYGSWIRRGKIMSRSLKENKFAIILMIFAFLICFIFPLYLLSYLFLR